MFLLFFLFQYVGLSVAAVISFNFYIYWPDGPVNHGQSIDASYDNVIVETSYGFGFASTLAEDYLEADDSGALVEVDFDDSAAVKASSGLYSAGINNPTRLTFWTVSGITWTKQLDINPELLPWEGNSFHQFQLGPDNAGIIPGDGFALFCHDVANLNCSLVTTDPWTVSTDFGFSSYVSSDWVALGDPTANLVLVYSRQNSKLANAIAISPQNVSTLNSALCPCDFGYSVAVEGEFLAIGSPGYNNDQGAVSIFYLTSEGEWGYHFFLSGIGSSTASFGYSLELFSTDYPLNDVSYTMLFVGAPNAVISSIKQGQVYSYRLSTSTAGSYELADTLRGFFITSSSNHDLGKDLAYTGKILYGGAPLAIPSSSTSPGRFYVKGYCQPNYRIITPDSDESYKTTCEVCTVGKYTTGGTVTVCSTCSTSAKPTKSSWITAPGCTYYECDSNYFGTSCLVCSEYKASVEGGSNQDLPENSHWVDGTSDCSFECDDYFVMSYDGLSCILPLYPSTPFNVTLSVVGPGMINVSWVTELLEDQSPIFSYRIKVKNWLLLSSFLVTVSDNDAVFGGTSLIFRSIIVYGLQANTSYSVSLQAKDVAQWGNETSFTDAITTFEDVTVASQPRSITGVAISGGAIEASWMSPVDSGGALLSHYIVDACVSSTSCVAYSSATLKESDHKLEVSYNCSFSQPLYPGESKTVSIYRLMVSTAYYIRVVACSAFGCSSSVISVDSFSPYSYVTVPSAPLHPSVVSESVLSSCMHWQAPIDLGGVMALESYWLEFNVVGFSSSSSSTLESLLSDLWHVSSASVLFYPSLNFTTSVYNGTDPLIQNATNCVSDLAASVKYSIDSAAENQAGIGNVASSSMLLTMDSYVYVPSAPESVVCYNSTSSSISLRITKPSYLGGLPMTDVKVYCGVSNYSSVIECHVASIKIFASYVEVEVDRLYGSSNYEFVVAGRNSVGLGQNKTVQNRENCDTLPAEIPPRPMAPVFLNFSASEASFYVTPSGSGGSPLLYFLVALTTNAIYRDRISEFNLTFPFYSTPSQELQSQTVKIYGLKANTVYYATTAVVNSVGSSSWSEFSFVVTDATPISPSLPRYLSADNVAALGLSSSDSISVSWKAPIDFGGSSLVGFIVQLIASDVASCHDFASSKNLLDIGSRFVDPCNQTGVLVAKIDLEPCVEPCLGDESWNVTFSALPFNSSFSMTVMAVTEDHVLGDAAILQLSTNLSKSAPTMPRNVFVQYVSDVLAFITWDVPKNDGGAVIDEFLVLVENENVAKIISVPANQKSATIDGLLPNSTYKVSIAGNHSLLGQYSDFVFFNTSSSDSIVIASDGKYHFRLQSNLISSNLSVADNSEAVVTTSSAISSLPYSVNDDLLLYSCGSSSMTITITISQKQQITLFDMESSGQSHCANTNQSNLFQVLEFEDQILVNFTANASNQFRVSDMSNLLSNVNVGINSTSIYRRLIRDNDYCFTWTSSAWAEATSLSCSDASILQQNNDGCESNLCSGSFIAEESDSCVCGGSTFLSWSERHMSLLTATLPDNTTFSSLKPFVFFIYEHPVTFVPTFTSGDHNTMQSYNNCVFLTSSFFVVPYLYFYPNEIVALGFLGVVESSYFAEISWTEPINIHGEYFVDAYEVQFGFFNGNTEIMLQTSFVLSSSNREIGLLTNTQWQPASLTSFVWTEELFLSTHSYQLEGIVPNVTYSAHIRACTLDNGSESVGSFKGFDISAAMILLGQSYAFDSSSIICSEWSDAMIFDALDSNISNPMYPSDFFESDELASSSSISLIAPSIGYGGSSLIGDYRDDSDTTASTIIIGADCSSVDSMGIDVVETKIMNLISSVSFSSWIDDGSVFNEIWFDFSQNNFTVWSCSVSSYDGPVINSTIEEMIYGATFRPSSATFLDSDIAVSCNPRWLQSNSCYRFWNFVGNNAGISTLSISTPPLVTLHAVEPNSPIIYIRNLSTVEVGTQVELDLQFNTNDGGSQLLNSQVQIAFIGSLRSMCDFNVSPLTYQFGNQLIPPACSNVLSLQNDNIQFYDSYFSAEGMWRTQTDFLWDADVNRSVVVLSNLSIDCLKEFEYWNPGSGIVEQIAGEYRQDLFENPSDRSTEFLSSINLTVPLHNLNYYEYAWKLAHGVENSVQAVIQDIDVASVVMVRGRVLSSASLWSNFSSSVIITSPSSAPSDLSDPIVAIVSSDSALIITPADSPSLGNGGCAISSFGIEIERRNPCSASNESDECIQSMPFVDLSHLTQYILVESGINSSCCQPTHSETSQISLLESRVDGNGDALDQPCVDVDTGLNSSLLFTREISISDLNVVLPSCKAEIVHNFYGCQSVLPDLCAANVGFSFALLLTGLVRNAQYSVRYWIENDIGKSDWSPQRNFTSMPVLPSSPIIDEYFSDFGDRMSVSFHVSDYGGARLNGFQVVYINGSFSNNVSDLSGFTFLNTSASNWWNGTTLFVPDDDTRLQPVSSFINSFAHMPDITWLCNVTSLSADTTYSFSVRSVSQFGSGEWSDLFAKKTKGPVSCKAAEDDEYSVAADDNVFPSSNGCGSDRGFCDTIFGTCICNEPYSGSHCDYLDGLGVFFGIHSELEDFEEVEFISSLATVLQTSSSRFFVLSSASSVVPTSLSDHRPTQNHKVKVHPVHKLSHETSYTSTKKNNKVNAWIRLVIVNADQDCTSNCDNPDVLIGRLENAMTLGDKILHSLTIEQVVVTDSSDYQSEDRLFIAASCSEYNGCSGCLSTLVDCVWCDFSLLDGNNSACVYSDDSNHTCFGPKYFGLSGSTSSCPLSEPIDRCSDYGCQQCNEDSACGWCSSTSSCLPLTEKSLCSGRYDIGKCFDSCNGDVQLSKQKGVISLGDSESMIYFSPSLTCRWVVSPLDKSSNSNFNEIEINLKQLNFGNSDVLKIYSSQVEAVTTLIVNIDGTNAATELGNLYTSKTGMFLITFKSDNTETYNTGFMISYKGIVEDFVDVYLLTGIILSSMAGCVIFLCICGRVCSGPLNSQLGENGGGDDGLEMMAPGLTADEIGMLCRCKAQNISGLVVKKKLQNEDCENPDANTCYCVVCMAEYCKNDDVIFLPCSHTFHSHCIVPWLQVSYVNCMMFMQSHRSCPLCKQDIRIALQRSEIMVPALEIEEDDEEEEEEEEGGVELIRLEGVNIDDIKANVESKENDSTSSTSLQIQVHGDMQVTVKEYETVRL